MRIHTNTKSPCEAAFQRSHLQKQQKKQPQSKLAFRVLALQIRFSVLAGRPFIIQQGCDTRALHHTWPGCSMPGRGRGGGSPLAMLDVLGDFDIDSHSMTLKQTHTSAFNSHSPKYTRSDTHTRWRRDRKDCRDWLHQLVPSLQLSTSNQAAVGRYIKGLMPLGFLTCSFIYLVRS